MSSPATILVTATRSGAAATVVINRGPAGSLTLAGLSDIETFDLPVENTPLADALALKADSASLATVAKSGSYDDLSDTPPVGFAVPEFSADTSLVANKAATTAVIQAMLDAGKSVRIPDGVYVLDPLFVKYKGTVIQGESIGGTWLDFSNIANDGRAISLVEDPADLANRMPGAANTGNNYGTFENLFITGPGKATTSVGIWTMPASEATVPETGWQGDAVTFRNIWVQGFGVGLHWNNPNKYFLENCLMKSCTTGLWADNAGTATNNTLLVHHIHISETTTGILSDGADMVITLGDATVVTTLIDQNGGNLEIKGGQLEGCQTILNCDAGAARMSQWTSLSQYGDIPIVVSNRGAVQVSNLVPNFAVPSGDLASDYDEFLEQTPLIHLTDNTSTAFGYCDFSAYGFSDFRAMKYMVRLWDGSHIHLSPFPLAASGNNPPSNDDESRGRIYYTVEGASDQGDDIRMLAKSGITVLESNDPYAKVSLYRPNYLTVTRTGTGNNPQAINGIERFVLQGGSSTKALTVRLPLISVTGATANNSHVVTIIDTDRDASLNTITIVPHPTDVTAGRVIVGGDTISEDGGFATFVTNGNGWFRAEEIINAGTLTGSTLNATVTHSSLVSVGTILSGTWQGTAIADAYIASAAAWNAQGALADSAVQEGDSPSFVDVTASGTVTGGAGSFTTLTASGIGTISNSLNVAYSVTCGTGTTAYYKWLHKSAMGSAVDGNITFYNAALNDFGRLSFGGNTSSFPAIKRNGTAINIRLADDSSDADLTCSNLTASGTISGGAGKIEITNSGLGMVSSSVVNPSWYLGVQGSSVLEISRPTSTSVQLRNHRDGDILLASAGGSVNIGAGGNLTASGTVTTGTYTVATLPTPSTGMRAQVTDSSVAAPGHFGATVTAGGSNTVPVFYDGTDWIIA